MSEKSTVQVGGIGLIEALGLLFIGLKLAGAITWSWGFVLLPFLPIVLMILLLLAAVIVSLFTK